MERVEVITGTERRRRYTIEEKHQILMEALSPGATIVGTSRKYGISSSLIHLWKKTFQVQNLLPQKSDFVRVAEKSPDDELRAIQIHIDGAIVVEVPLSVDPKSLGAILRSLRS